MASRPKQPADIICSYKRKTVPVDWGLRLDDCLRICAGWHNRIGSCLRLNDDRLRAICRRLADDRFTYAQIAWAIEAYAEHCKTDRWHVEHPDARMSLERFLYSDKFESWVTKGEELQTARSARRRSSAQRGQVDDAARQMDALYGAFQALPEPEKARLVQQAAAELGLQGKGLTNVLVRGKVLQLFQKASRQDQAAVRPLGHALEEALG